MIFSPFHTKHMRKKFIIFLIFIAPAMMFYLIELYCILDAILMSFHRWTVLSPPKYVGLKNFIKLLDDEYVHNAAMNTLKWMVVSLIASVTVPILIALLLNCKLRGETLYKVVFILPQALSGVAVGVAWTWMFSPGFGVINETLRALGLKFLIRSWIGDPSTALYACVAGSIWVSTGFYTMIYLTRLRDIPQDLLEAARVDGASPWQVFIYVTLPLMREAFAIVTTLTILSSFKAFDIVLTMTRGGPQHASEVLGLRIYIEGFELFRMGYASTISTALLLLSLVFVILYLRLILRRR